MSICMPYWMTSSSLMNIWMIGRRKMKNRAVAAIPTIMQQRQFLYDEKANVNITSEPKYMAEPEKYQ